MKVTTGGDSQGATEITAARGEGGAEPEQGQQEGGQEMCGKKMPPDLVAELAGAVIAPSQQGSACTVTNSGH